MTLSTTPSPLQEMPASMVSPSIDAQETPETVSPAQPPHPGEGLASRSFLGLLATQFLGAMNDNIFRWLVVPVGKDLVSPEYQGATVSAGLAMLVLPFLLLAGPAGYLADRFSKQRVIIGCKIAEVILMILGTAAVLYGNVYVMFFVLFLMGAQSALFGPSKYGSIPELVRADRIPGANGLIGLTTILAIVAGTVIGGFLYYWTRPLGQQQWWLYAVVLIGVAAVGLATSFLIRPLRSANPSRRFPFDLAGQAIRDIRILAAQRGLLWAALASALFWSLAGLCQVNVDRFTTLDLDLGQQHVGPLLALLAIGVGAGNLLAAWWSRGRIELGIVPVGATGIAIGAMLLSTVASGRPDLISSPYLMSAAWLFLLGLGAGMYDVPLQSYLQANSPDHCRGAILAATSFLTFAGTVVASGVFFVMTSLWGLSGRTIFLITGAAVLPIIVLAVWYQPLATLRLLARACVRLLYRLRVEGIENLPPTGGALLVANHISWIDGILLVLVAPRHIRMVAHADYVNLRWPRRLVHQSGVISIAPGRKAVIQAIRTAREALLQGDVVCIFPEGALSRTGQIHEFHPGFLSMVKDTTAPVIPVYLGGLWGSVFSFERGKFFWKWPRRWPYRISIRFGRPLSHPAHALRVRQAVQELEVVAMQKDEDRSMTLPRRFLRMCRRTLRHPKLADWTGVELAGAGMLTRALILRRLLRRHVLEAGERNVGLLLPPSTAGALANAAISIDRRVAVNLNYTVSSEVMNQCIAQAGIRHVLTSRRVLERFPLELNAEVVFLEDFKDKVTLIDKLIAAAQTWLLPAAVLERWLGLHRVSPDDLLTIIFTSGSTGMPKGAMLSQDNVGSNVTAFNKLLRLKREDVLVGILPFFHSFGYTTTLWSVLTLDSKVVYHYTPLEPRQVGKLSREHGGTILVATPTFLRSYVRRCEPEDFAKLDTVIAGAEKLSRDLADAFENKFGVRPSEGYGTTELSPVVSVNMPASRMADGIEQGAREGSVGQPLPGVVAKIVDLDTGEDLEPGKPGMLLITGPNVMQGYLGMPEQTAKVLRDGWYVTGDVAFLDEDGFIHITGRESRFSKIGGEMVPHLRIEEALGEVLCLQDEEEIPLVVTGIPDPKKGERVVVLHTGLGVSPEEACRRLAAAGLPALWIPSPDSFCQVDAIPVLGTGKLDLKQVKDLALEKFGVVVP
jgi:acyl-[acyl-carrier-protein]-phospholipid O-acyltransferase/long-chain-fatty-acid--[acyl-carrier-protein] ligase